MDKRVRWSKNMEVGYAPLDKAHRDFIKIINEAYVYTASREMTSMDNVFEKCYDYARNHFPEEENIMKQVGFPDMASHEKSHHAFIKNISEIRVNFHKATTRREKEQLSGQAADFLKAWFLGHTLSRDKIYKPYLVRLDKNTKK